MYFRVSKKMVWLPILGTFNLHSDVNASECTRGSTNTLKESALKVKCGRRIFCRPWESNLRQPRARPDAEPMSPAPFQHHKFRLIIFFFVWPPFFQQTRESFGKEVEGGSFGPVKTWMTSAKPQSQTSSSVDWLSVIRRTEGQFNRLMSPEA